MIKEFIGTGKTVEEATSAAKAGLGAPDSADVKVEIVEMPKKGFLGLGSKPAQVKVSYDDGVKESAPKKKPSKQKTEAKKQQSQQKPAKKAPVKKETQKPAKQEVKEPKKERDYPESVDLEYAKSYFGEIVKGLEITDAKIDAEYSEGVVTLTLECDDYGIVIGRRGETLDSIQYLLSLAMKKSSNGYVRVAINVGNYREKRTETLKHLAAKNAAYVLKTGRRHTFEPAVLNRIQTAAIAEVRVLLKEQPLRTQTVFQRLTEQMFRSSAKLRLIKTDLKSFKRGAMRLVFFFAYSLIEVIFYQISTCI